MSEIRDGKSMRMMWRRLLVERTGESVEIWNQRIEDRDFKDQRELRAGLKEQGVEGYAQTLLVMEQSGYPDYLLASADELIDGQYEDRPHLRPILEAVLEAASGLGEFTIQARNTCVSLVSPRRRFARVQPTTKRRVDLALRVEDQEPGGRLVPSRVHESTPIQFERTSANGVDDGVLGWLEKAYEQKL